MRTNNTAEAPSYPSFYVNLTAGFDYSCGSQSRHIYREKKELRLGARDLGLCVEAYGTEFNGSWLWWLQTERETRKKEGKMKKTLIREIRDGDERGMMLGSFVSPAGPMNSRHEHNGELRTLVSWPGYTSHYQYKYEHLKH